MQPSRYNFFFDAENGTHLAFNALSGGLATLTEEKHRQVQEILRSPNSYRYDSQAKLELREKLLQGGFLLREGVDELDILKVRYRSSRFNPRPLKLTILPTLRCNFRCIYCYEGRKNITMSREIQRGLVEFVRKKTEGVESLTTSWYGGEPLLALDIIAYLRGEFAKICEAKGIKYSPGGIVTNGYLLTRDVAKRLKEMGIETAQVTLDGPREVHDQRRPLANGRGSFDRIMENLSQVSKVLKQIQIRVNTDRNNADRVLELLDAIEDYGLKGKVSIYFAKVMAHTEACASIAGSCLRDQEYTDLELRLTKGGLEKGFNLAKYPRPKFHYCEADHVNSFVVGPSGYLYKCWSDPGNPDEAVGHVSDPTKYEEKKRNVLKWLAWDVFEREECRECKLLPVCLGGCPYVGLRLETRTRGACDNWRYNLLGMLKLYYAGRLSNPLRQGVGRAKGGKEVA